MNDNIMRDIIKRNREALGMDGLNDDRFIDSFVAVNKEVSLEAMSEYFCELSHDAYPIIADGLLIGYEEKERSEYDFTSGIRSGGSWDSNRNG